jgi:ligand-binding sensor domain-containing protein
MTNDGARALAALPDGSVWVATGRSLNRIADGGRRAFDLDRTMAMHTSTRRAALGGHGVGRRPFDERGFHPEPIPTGVRYGRIVSLTTDGWWPLAVQQRTGIVAMARGHLENFGSSSAVTGRPCSVVFTDSHGRVWAAFAAGGVAVHENGAFRIYSESDGLARGRIGVIHEDRRGAIWMSSATGLTRLREGVSTTVTRGERPP